MFGRKGLLSLVVILQLEDLPFKGEDLHVNFPPASTRQPCLLAGMIQECCAVPPVFAGNLGEQETAPPVPPHDEAVPTDLDGTRPLFRGNAQRLGSRKNGHLDPEHGKPCMPTGGNRGSSLAAASAASRIASPTGSIGCGNPIHPRRHPALVSVTNTPRFREKIGVTAGYGVFLPPIACSRTVRARRRAVLPSSAVRTSITSK